MIEYKVGLIVFVSIKKYWVPTINGYAVIENVGRKYAEIRVDECQRYAVEIKGGRIFCMSDKKTAVGTAYASEQEYFDRCAIEKYAEHIKHSVGIIGYRGFLECSMEELKKIASILKINLD